MKHESPLLQLVDQLYAESTPVDVTAEVAKGFKRAGLGGAIEPSARIAITAGSRGIGDLPAGETLRPAGPRFPLPYDEDGDLRSPFGAF